MIVGGALDLQEKVVKEAMTPIDKVFMLPFTAKLDYKTLELIVRSGHSRVPVYQEVDVQVRSTSGTATPKRIGILGNLSRRASGFSSKDTSNHTNDGDTSTSTIVAEDEKSGSRTLETVKRKKIIGTLLVKQCVLLDPEDATPVSDMVINALPTVPGDEPLLNVLNVFQVSPRRAWTL